MTIVSGGENGFFAEFLDDFFAECDEHLTGIRRNLLLLESFSSEDRQPQSVLDELFRSFHSLKGLAGMVGAQVLEQITHEVESFLRLLRQRQVRLTRAALDVLVAATGLAESAIVAFKTHAPMPDVEPVLTRLTALTSEATDRSSRVEADLPAPPLNPDEQARLAAAIAEDLPIWAFDFRPSTALAERGINVAVVRERLQDLGTIIRAAPQVLPGGSIIFAFLVATSTGEDDLAGWRDDGIDFRPYHAPAPEHDDSAVTPTDATGAQALQAVSPANMVRVDLARLDELMQLIGGLVILRSRLHERVLRLEKAVPVQEWRELQDLNLLLERQLRTLRSAVTRTRTVPIGDAFARMQFVVRDLVRDSGQQVRIELSGQDTALDKYVVDRITDPLLHLVRNAVSHGLEPSAERIGAGKPAQASIALRAATTGDEVVIEIEDDGRGVDAAAVAERAQKLGLSGTGVPLDDEQLLEVLCAPGFSTRETADRASGRGIGMAVVQKIVQELGGTLRIATRPGAGTRFTMRLPLTVLIIDALLVAVAGRRFVVPLSAVRELIDLQDVTTVAFENNEITTYRGDILSLIHLARCFGFREPGLRRYAIVVGDERRMAGLVIDRVYGKHEIVVRPLTDPLTDVDGFSGATELGDGRAVLILDAAELVHGSARSLHRPGRSGLPDIREGGIVQKSTATAAGAGPYILFALADTTYGIPSGQVKRIELIEEITPVPNAYPALDGVVFSRGQLIPVISLRARFGLPKLAYDIRTRLIVVTVDDRTVGLVVDTAREFVNIPSDAIQTPPETIGNLSGTYLEHIAMLGERLVLLLDITAVLDFADLVEQLPEDGEKGEA